MSLPRLELPKYELKLPLSNRIISYRPFTVKERTILLVALQDEKIEPVLSAVRDIIKVCTFGECDMEKMPIVEVEYVFLKIKNKSIGETQDVIHTCECGAQNEFALNMDNTEVVGEIKDTAIDLGANNWIKMHYPSFVDTIGLAGEPDEEDVKNIIAACIDSIIVGDAVYAAKDSTKEELIEFIDGLTQHQMNAIEEFFGSIPKLCIKHDYTCPKCQKVNNVEVAGLENFFQ